MSPRENKPHTRASNPSQLFALPRHHRLRNGRTREAIVNVVFSTRESPMLRDGSHGEVYFLALLSFHRLKPTLGKSYTEFPRSSHTVACLAGKPIEVILAVLLAITYKIEKHFIWNPAILYCNRFFNGDFQEGEKCRFMLCTRTLFSFEDVKFIVNRVGHVEELGWLL